MYVQHPSPTDLLLVAVAGDVASVDEAVERHVRDCSWCRSEVDGLRDVAVALRTGAGDRPAEDCLDDIDIARLTDAIDLARDRSAISHLASCARCRAQLSGTKQLVTDPLVSAELGRLPKGRPQRRSSFAIAGALAAAALAGVLLWPAERLTTPEPVQSTDPYRDRTLTTTSAPRILAPLGNSTSADSLRWSSVPGADLYRITFWRPTGEVAWTGETRDTVLGVPGGVSRSGEAFLLWDVRARTGWDRWVVSDLVEFTLSVPGGMSR